MIKTGFLSLTILTALAAGSANAAVLDVTFAGTVASAQGNVFVANQAITGEFVYNTTTGAFSLFTIGGVAAPAGLTPSTSFSGGNFGAFYSVGTSAVQQGGSVNQNFTLDLEALNTAFTDATPAALLTDTAALATNLDTNPGDAPSNSTFSYLFENSNGTNVNSVTANLASIQTTVPEPASLALFGTAACAMLLRRRRG